MKVLLIALSIISTLALANAKDLLRVLLAPEDSARPESKLGFIDAKTGQVQLGGLVKSQKDDCYYHFDLEGTTVGQTSTYFYMNGTWFLLANENCAGSSVPKTAIVGIRGPFDYNVSEFSAYRLDYVENDSHLPLSSFNMNWDWTCNVNTLVPVDNGNSRTFKTLQISEYDSQIRPKKDYLEEQVTCKNCWQKVSGPGAQDSGDGKSSWPLGQEWSCGDSCGMWVLEQYIDDEGKPDVHQPRRLVSRSFRTGALIQKSVEQIRVQSLTFHPKGFASGSQSKVTSFLGIGVCCEDYSWCAESCKNLDGRQVLFSFVPSSTNPWAVLAPLGTQVSSDAARLGVGLSRMGTFGYSPFPVYVAFDQHVHQYVVTTLPDGHFDVKLNYTSTHRYNQNILAWAFGPGF